MIELVHTSAPKGLGGARSGYSVVAATRGMPPELSASLVAGSAAPVQRLGPDVEPEPFAVYRIWPPAPRLVAISRIVPVAADFSGRPARLAHHVVLEPNEASGAVAAALLLDRKTFRDSWAGDPEELPARQAPAPATAGELLSAESAFERLTDAAKPWIGHLAESASRPRDRPAVVLVPAEAPLATLLAALLAARPSAMDARIETSDDRIAESRPSLLLLRATRSGQPLPSVIADWSVARGTAPPPCAPAAAVRAAAPIRDREDPPELGPLPPPPPALHGRTWDAAPARPAATCAAPLERPEAAADHPTTPEALCAFATGAAAGAVLAVAALQLAR